MCELLGLDPLYVANEGKLLATVVARADADRVLAACALGQTDATPVSSRESSEDPARLVVLKTQRIGARRIVDMLQGDQLPRIC